MERKRNQVELLKINQIDYTNEPIKEQDAQLYQKLKMGIELRGQVKNIVVCKVGERYECIEGSKILRILSELNEDEVLAVNLGELSEAQKNLVKIEISKDYFLTDYVMIGRLLKNASKELRLQDMCNTIPFDLRQAEHLIEMTEFDWEDFAQGRQNENQVSLFDDSTEFERQVEEQKEYFETSHYEEVTNQKIENPIDVYAGALKTETKIEIDFSKVEAAIQKQDWLIAKWWCNQLLEKHPNNDEILTKLQTIQSLEIEHGNN